MKAEDDAIQKLYNWQFSYSGCFSDLLFELLVKADHKNYERLANAFPEYAKALRDWGAAGDYGNDLFRQYKIGIFGEGFVE